MIHENKGNASLIVFHIIMWQRGNRVLQTLYTFRIFSKPSAARKYAQGLRFPAARRAGVSLRVMQTKKPLCGFFVCMTLQGIEPCFEP